LSQSPSAALLVRVWLEDGPATFRSRVTALGRSERGRPPGDVTVAVVLSPGDLLLAIRDWLDAFVSQAGERFDDNDRISE
jgi:hypothetical protein